MRWIIEEIAEGLFVEDRERSSLYLSVQITVRDGISVALEVKSSSEDQLEVARDMLIGRAFLAGRSATSSLPWSPVETF